MPNWCENDLEISGPVKDLKKLREMIKNTEEDTLFDFNKVIPYPEKFDVLDKKARENEAKRLEAAKKYGKKHTNDLTQKQRDAVFKKYPDIRDGYNQGGYNWCHENWGTKWNACDVSESPDLEGKGTKALYYYFNTAWAPPEPVIKKLGKMFPTLTFNLKYYECGCGFKGELEIVNGKIEIENCEDYTEKDFEEDDDGNKWGRGG